MLFPKSRASLGSQVSWLKGSYMIFASLFTMGKVGGEEHSQKWCAKLYRWPCLRACTWEMPPTCDFTLHKNGRLENWDVRAMGTVIIKTYWKTKLNWVQMDVWRKCMGYTGTFPSNIHLFWRSTLGALHSNIVLIVQIRNVINNTNNYLRNTCTKNIDQTRFKRLMCYYHEPKNRVCIMFKTCE
jgi:hypothetical protein